MQKSEFCRLNSIIILIIGAIAVICSVNVFAQESTATTSKSHSISIKTQYIQIKDEFNYGLVFSGPNLAVGYSCAKTSSKDRFTYTPELAFGGVFNKGAGYAWRFKPIDIFYARNINSKPIAFGAYLATDYQWQQYSELQGGRLFWFSTVEIGPRVEFKLPYRSHLFKITFSNSLVGFTSRPEPSTETHFYAFSFSEFISVAHENLTFGSFNQFNRTKLGVELKRDSWKRFSMGYSFEYFGYYKAPKLSYINHSLNFSWNL